MQFIHQMHKNYTCSYHGYQALWNVQTLFSHSKATKIPWYILRLGVCFSAGHVSFSRLYDPGFCMSCGRGMGGSFLPSSISASISSTVRGTQVSSSIPVSVTAMSSSIRTCKCTVDCTYYVDKILNCSQSLRYVTWLSSFAVLTIDM